MQSYHWGRRGFSLVELLIVITILMVLCAMALVRFMEATTSAKEQTCRANVRAIRQSIATYEAKKGSMPGSLQAVVDAGILDAAPKCPFAKDYEIKDGEISNLKDHFAGDWMTDSHK